MAAEFKDRHRKVIRIDYNCIFDIIVQVHRTVITRGLQIGPKRINMYKYVFRAVGCFPGPYLAKRFTEVHIN